MRFCILASGSSGNSALIVTEGARVLVDAGLSARKIDGLLRGVGQTLAEVDAVFLTHEHGDHATGIEGLKRHPHIKVFANAATARAVQEGLSHRPAWQIFETGSRFGYRDLEVRSFPVPHDARDPVGYCFATGREGDLFEPRRSLAWLTDLGHAPANLREHLQSCDVVVVESNHCPRLLEADARRSWSTKQRIRGSHGHLSNQAASEFLASAASPRWRRIFLAHLSRDCNTREAIETAFAGVSPPLPCGVSIVGAGEGTPFFDIA